MDVTVPVKDEELSASAVRRSRLAIFLVRQLGTKIHPGTNVGCGRDYTLFATVDGIVTYEEFGKDKKRVSVYPAV